MDPITAAVVGTTALSGVMGFKGQKAAAKNAERVAEYNAKLAEEEKKIVAKAKAQEEVNLRKQSERLIGTQRATTAASGIQMAGSPLQALADTYFNTEMDALQIQYSSNVEQAQKTAEAALARAGGQARKSALTTQAYTTLLSSAGQTANLMK